MPLATAIATLAKPAATLPPEESSAERTESSTSTGMRYGPTASGSPRCTCSVIAFAWVVRFSPSAVKGPAISAPIPPSIASTAATTNATATPRRCTTL